MFDYNYFLILLDILFTNFFSTNINVFLPFFVFYFFILDPGSPLLSRNHFVVLNNVVYQ